MLESNRGGKVMQTTQSTIDVREVIRTVLALPDDKLRSIYDLALQLASIEKATAISSQDDQQVESILRYMQGLGWIKNVGQTQTLTDFQPVQISGEPLSEMIIRERR